MGILEVKDLSKNFGGLSAVGNVHFDVNQEELFSVIGPNGAGKTTLFNLISGFLRPSHGKILFEGDDITGWRPHQIAKKGIMRTFQTTTLFKNYTVLANTEVAYHLQLKAGFAKTVFNTSTARRDNVNARERSLEILELMGLDDLQDELAKNLPHGHQRKLGIAIALVAQPKLLLLDEPVTGMNPEETINTMNLIREIQRKVGITVILVEHDMKAVMGFSDRIMVLNYGKKIAEGLPEGIRANKEVVEAYLGRETL
jgi:branched-chain amino acid transport system ATP-binding protein